MILFYRFLTSPVFASSDPECAAGSAGSGLAGSGQDPQGLLARGRGVAAAGNSLPPPPPTLVPEEHCDPPVGGSDAVEALGQIAAGSVGSEGLRALLVGGAPVQRGLAVLRE